MPRKHKQGRQHYLDYLEHSARILGGARVRSMLMLGLEPLDHCLEGVETIGRAREITTRYGVRGTARPAVHSVAHNTLTMPATHGHGDAHVSFGRPKLV